MRWQSSLKACASDDTIRLFADVVTASVKNPTFDVERALQSYNDARDSEGDVLINLVKVLASEVENLAQTRAFFGDPTARDPSSTWDDWWQFASINVGPSFVNKKQYHIYAYDQRDQYQPVKEYVSLREIRELIYSKLSQFSIHGDKKHHIMYRTKSNDILSIMTVGPFGSYAFLDATDDEREYLGDIEDG